MIRLRTSMRVLKYIGAVASILASGCLLLGYYGLSITAQDRANGWQISELPAHPVANMFIFLMLGLVLPFFSAWLMAPSQATSIDGRAERATLWAKYLLRLTISLAGAFLVACLLAFLEMALLDGGVI
jgi:hypothetical protein